MPVYYIDNIEVSGFAQNNDVSVFTLSARIQNLLILLDTSVRW